MLKYKYRNREFWYRGYYVATAVKKADNISKSIQIKSIKRTSDARVGKPFLG